MKTRTKVVRLPVDLVEILSECSAFHRSQPRSTWSIPEALDEVLRPTLKAWLDALPAQNRSACRARIRAIQRELSNVK